MSDLILHKGVLHSADQPPVKLSPLGRGRSTRLFTTIGKRPQVFTFVGDDSHEFGQEILSSVGLESKHLPRVKKVGNTASEYVYKAPLYERLRVAHKTAWAQYRVLQACNDEARLKVRRKLLDWQFVQSGGYEVMSKTIECAERHKVVTLAMRHALERVRDTVADYGADWTFGFSPGVLGVDRRGNLVFVDILYSPDVIMRARHEANKRIAAKQGGR